MYLSLTELETEVCNHIVQCEKFDRLYNHYSMINFDTVYTCTCGKTWVISDLSLKKINNYNCHWLNHITSDSVMYRDMKKNIKKDEKKYIKEPKRVNNSFSMLKIND